MIRRLSSIALLALFLAIPAVYEDVPLIVGYVMCVSFAFCAAFICWTNPLWKENQQ